MKDLLEKYSGYFTKPGEETPLLEGGLRSSIYDQVYEELRESILSSVLEPGSRLIEEKLATELAVGCVPVREALLRLESENMVTLLPDDHFAVSLFTIEDLKEIYFMRSVLEGTAAGVAANNLSQEELLRLEELCQGMEKSLEEEDFDNLPLYNAGFHQTIYQAAKSPRLYRLIVQLWNSFPKSSMGFLTLRAPVIVKEHKEIFKRLQKRDAEGSEEAVREHIIGALGDLAEYWNSHLDGDK